jgi:lysophospholipase L1-like esterase
VGTVTTWESFVAIGDSFTEGVGDPLPDGTFRGWADLVAAGLARHSPGLRYANLAVRGRTFDGVAGQQVTSAVDLRPDLVSFAAGGNDALRRGFDLAALMERFDGVVGRLRESGADVVLFRFPDMSVRLPFPAVLRPRIVAMNDTVAGVAARHGAYLVDLFGDRAFDDPRLWNEDRLHLNAAGHRRVASQVLAALGLAATPKTAASRPVRTPWPAARAADLRWARAYFGPWLHRRLTGRSSGDGVRPKRPDLHPLIEPGRSRL